MQNESKLKIQSNLDWKKEIFSQNSNNSAKFLKKQQTKQLRKDTIRRLHIQKIALLELACLTRKEN